MLKHFMDSNYHPCRSQRISRRNARRFPLLFQRRGGGGSFKNAARHFPHNYLCFSHLRKPPPCPSFGKGGESGGKPARNGRVKTARVIMYKQREKACCILNENYKQLAIEYPQSYCSKELKEAPSYSPERGREAIAPLRSAKKLEDISAKLLSTKS